MRPPRSGPSRAPAAGLAVLAVLALTVLVPPAQACTAPPPYPQQLVVRHMGAQVLRLDAGMSTSSCMGPGVEPAFDGRTLVWQGTAYDGHDGGSQALPEGALSLANGRVHVLNATRVAVLDVVNGTRHDVPLPSDIEWHLSGEALWGRQEGTVMVLEAASGRIAGQIQVPADLQVQGVAASKRWLAVLEPAADGASEARLRAWRLLDGQAYGPHALPARSGPETAMPQEPWTLERVTRNLGVAASMVGWSGMGRWVERTAVDLPTGAQVPAPPADRSQGNATYAFEPKAQDGSGPGGTGSPTDRPGQGGSAAPTGATGPGQGGTSGVGLPSAGDGGGTQPRRSDDSVDAAAMPLGAMALALAGLVASRRGR